METRRNEGVTTYDLLGLTVTQHNTLLRALYQAHKEHGDTEAESLRVVLLGGTYPS